MVYESSTNVNNFAITQAVRCHRDFGEGILDVLPGLLIADMRVGNEELTILVPMTAEQIQAINGHIQRIADDVESTKATRRAGVNTFAWMQGKPARQWQRALDPRKRVTA